MKKVVRFILWFINNVLGRVAGIALLVFLFICDRKISPDIINGMDLLLIASSVPVVILLFYPISEICSWIKTRIKNFIRFIKEEEDNYDESYDDEDWNILIK